MVVANTELAGQWAKQQSLEIQRRTTLYIFAACFIMIGVFAFLAGLSTRGVVGGVFVLLAVPIALGGLYVINRRMDHILEQGAKRRLAVLLGAQAEAYVSYRLRDLLDNRWHLFDNLKLDATSDIDHVLVGPSGIFVISTKSQKGRFQYDPSSGDWLPTMNGMQCDWCQDAIRQAVRLKDQLAVVDPAPTASGMPWIQAVLCLPFAHVEVPGKPPKVNQCWVVNEDTLMDALEPEPMPKGRTKLHKTTQARLVTALQTLADRHAAQA